MTRELPVLRQRLAVRALVRRGDEVLLARISAAAPGAGLWTLPGGGVDHGEDPEDTLRREVYEETGQRVDPTGVLGVYSRRFVGRSPAGVLEDFHAVHVIYRARVTGTGEARVIEVDGTTDAVGWFPVTALARGGQRLADVVGYALDRADGHFDRDQATR